MMRIIWMMIVMMVCSVSSGFAQPSEQERAAREHVESLDAPLFKPFIERYVLDELRDIRRDVQQHRAQVERDMADQRLEVSDRALRYSADTMNNIFILITITVSILVLLGLNSIRDIKARMEGLVANKVEEITQEYRKRLLHVEETLRAKTDQIIAAQEEIAKTNEVHSLWMRAGLETNVQQKIEIYDEILKINRDDAEVFTYKADAVLELGEIEWAINLCNKAIEVDEDYGYAYWQLACAHAELGNEAEAIENLRIAIEKSPTLTKDIETEASFKTLRQTQAFADAMLINYDG